MGNFDSYKYEDKLTAKSKISRFLWGLIYLSLFRTTPSFALNNWRVFLLKLFGARIGVHCKIDSSSKIWAPWNLTLGDYVCFAEGVDCYCVSPINIGSKVTISQRSFLCSASHDIKLLKRPLIHSPIVIDNHAWVCAEAFVGPGITIGEGAVVGAMAVVTRDVEPWTVVAGNPARKVKDRVIQQS